MSIVKPSLYDGVLVHSGTMSQYEIAAAQITFLREKLTELTKEDDKLWFELEALDTPYSHMMNLLNVIRDNPGLLDGWRQFLAKANIEEPS